MDYLFLLAREGSRKKKRVVASSCPVELLFLFRFHRYVIIDKWFSLFVSQEGGGVVLSAASLPPSPPPTPAEGQGVVEKGLGLGIILVSAESKTMTASSRLRYKFSLKAA